MEILLILACILFLSQKKEMPPQKLIRLIASLAEGKGAEGLMNSGLLDDVRILGMTPQQLAEAANDLKTVLNAVSAGAPQSDAPDKNTRRCTTRRGTLNQEDSPAAESVRNSEDGEGLLPVSGIADENIGRMLGKYFTSAD